MISTGRFLLNSIPVVFGANAVSLSPKMASKVGIVIIVSSPEVDNQACFIGSFITSGYGFAV